LRVSDEGEIIGGGHGEDGEGRKKEKTEGRWE